MYIKKIVNRLKRLTHANSSKGNEMEIKKNIIINGKSYEVVSDDIYLSQMGTEFEPHMVSLFKKLISKTDNIVDVGANIGLISILFSEIANKVMSFEASTTTYEILMKNVQQNNLNNVTAINFGLGDENAKTTITFNANNRSGGFVSDKLRPTDGHITEQIQLKKLDDIWDFNERCNFIKLDVEGFEGNVISGAKNVLNTFKPIVVLELNHWCLNAFRRISIPDFFDMLRSFFPVLYAVDTDNATIKNLHDPEEAYYVMHEHIVKFRFPNIVAGFNNDIKQRILS
jgi:FkbM family methyltransferase